MVCAIIKKKVLSNFYLYENANNKSGAPIVISNLNYLKQYLLNKMLKYYEHNDFMMLLGKNDIKKPYANLVKSIRLFSSIFYNFNYVCLFYLFLLALY